MNSSGDTSQNSDNENILKHAGELFRQLGITKPEPDTVVWDHGMKPDLVVVKYGEVSLPRSMMHRMTDEDWKPLLAPAIIYSYALLPNNNRNSLIHLVLPLGLGEIPLVIALLQIFRLGKQDYTLSRTLLTATLIIWISYEALVLGLWIKWRYRRLSYTADRRAAHTVGSEVLLAALAKYGEAISATGYPRKRLHLWPTVSQRIERLQNAAKIPL